jgi:hypothetical protein
MESHSGAVEKAHHRAVKAHSPATEDHREATLIKMKKRNFFSEEVFTINKDIFPYCQGKNFLPNP